MAKQKTPSPQELYRAREKEKNALLPPGLVNHGNTCFMNSVLQGLIATQYLERLVLFKPTPSEVQLTSPIHIASPRSPALTNGHGLGGEHDQPWADGLPIGDQFINVMRKAWEIQNSRQRANMSPKDLLAVMGKKYDQYLDFSQQDAHEFLCHLLDAIRMEEMDIIKKRFPSADKERKHSRPSSLKSSTADPPSEWEGLPTSHPPETRPSYPTQPSTGADDEPVSFVDMLFGGKLASILVCQACKHVSHTYEDFSDLSLSMKPEDYVRERKRDKLKQFAKKLGSALSVGAQAPRSSSVPATPVRDTTLSGPADTDPPRRRSVDLADVEVVAEPTVGEKPRDPGVVDEGSAVQSPSPPTSDSSPIPVTPPPAETPLVVPVVDLHEPQQSSGEHIAFVEPEKINGKEKKDKDESWAKLSRRISISVGLSWRSKQEKKEKDGAPLLSASKTADEGSSSFHIVSTPATPVSGVVEHVAAVEREAPSLQAVDDRLYAQLVDVKRSTKSAQLPINSPSIPSTPRFPQISRPSSPALHSKPSKPSRVPKPSAKEAAYLRDILADINPPNTPKPFSIFKQPKESSTSSFNTHNIFLKVNRISKIEECLRLFTSVEVLDGENNVRCHRCWKIANGYYKPRPRESAQEPDSCTDSEDDEAVGASRRGSSKVPDSTPANTIPATPSSHASSPSHSTTSFQDTLTFHDTQSTLTHTSTPGPLKPVPPSLQLNDTYPIELPSPNTATYMEGGLTVPSISATAPETPMSMKTAKPTPSRGGTISSAFTHTLDTTDSWRYSLSAPPDQHRRQGFRSGDSNTESETSEAESETLHSVYSDVSSAASLNPSPNASQDRLPQPSATRDAASKKKRHPSGVPHSKQFILRPAYKRYLIATPPPILVVHLKRFQQISKGPVLSFSTGFKKLDDYIAFPEYLDLAPYLAPRREDYFESKIAVTRGRARRQAPCMYRLYAVVVHIGNLLGGHYVAYTALPPSTSDSVAQSDNEKHQPKHGPAPRDWAFVSDTVVRLSTLEEALNSKAYICMYERI